MAPSYAVPRLLARVGMKLQDFDLIEIHEAFASTVLTTAGRWEDEAFCRDRLGLDAPLGVDRPGPAQRHRFVAGDGPPVRRDRRTDRRHPGEVVARQGFWRRGLISICAAGGQGVVAVIEAA